MILVCKIYVDYLNYLIILMNKLIKNIFFKVKLNFIIFKGYNFEVGEGFNRLRILLIVKENWV